MSPEQKLVILVIALLLAVLSFVYVSLPALGTLPVLSSGNGMIILFAFLLVVCAIAVFLLYRKAVIHHPETNTKMALRKRLDFK